MHADPTVTPVRRDTLCSRGILRFVVLLALHGIACGDDPAAMQQPGIGAAGITSSGGFSAAGANATGGFGSGQAGIAGAPIAGSGGAGLPGTGGASGQSAAGAGMSTGGTLATGGIGGSAGMDAAGQDGGTAGASGMDGAPDDYAPCPPAGEVCKILPLGDSITDGIGYSGGYRVELFRKALADGKDITFTGSGSNGPSMVDGATFPRSHEGHSGWKIDQLRSLIPMPALQQQPHIILLKIGTNDIAQNDNPANAPERLDSLIELLATNAPDALIVVATLIPLSFGGTAVETYNAAIPDVVDAHIASGTHVMLVDQFTGFPVSELGDGVHPNQQGYERMAGVWYEAIASMLP